ncbi:hypothetical protein [Frankia sp. AvcI1]|uniref:hypothetical protein n=1 Tax=Frankia sp. AvcI1 TaxID=573496 RepID=UPI0006EC0284|nr:hypothetical protein [Frankia sp. AvcI1]
MSGQPQQEPVTQAGSPLALLLQDRYERYKRHGVSLGAIARYLQRQGTTAEQRNLAAKIGRFFRDGSGAPSQRWSYLAAEIRLGYPEEEQQAQLEACAELYHRAFPAATDCPYGGSPELSFEDYVRRNIEESMRILGRSGGAEDLSDEDLRLVAERLMPLLDGASLFNPCLHWMSTVRDNPERGRHPEDLLAITQCDEQLAAFDRQLATVTRGAADRLRLAIREHRAAHRRALARPDAPAGLAGADPTTGLDASTGASGPGPAGATLPAPHALPAPHTPPAPHLPPALPDPVTPPAPASAWRWLRTSPPPTHPKLGPGPGTDRAPAVAGEQGIGDADSSGGEPAQS